MNDPGRYVSIRLHAVKLDQHGCRKVMSNPAFQSAFMRSSWTSIILLHFFHFQVFQSAFMRSSWTSMRRQLVGISRTFQSAFMRSSWTSLKELKELIKKSKFQSAFMRSSWTSLEAAAEQGRQLCFNPPSCGQAGPAHLLQSFDIG